MTTPITTDPHPTSSGWAYRPAEFTDQTVPLLRTDIGTRCGRSLRSRYGLVDEKTLNQVLGDFGVIASELLTNALRHAAAKGFGPVEVIVALEPDDLLLVVHDGSGQGPLLDTTDPGQHAGGLGLHLVMSLTDDRWGWKATARGKFVWARFSLDTLVADGEQHRGDAAPDPAARATSLTPAHDGALWLSRALPEGERDRPFTQWGSGAPAGIPLGWTFRAVVVAAGHAQRAIGHLTLAGLPLGPALLHNPVDAPPTVTFLVPTASPDTAPVDMAFVPDGSHLLCPRPGTVGGEHRWIVAPDGSGELTDLQVLHQALAATSGPPCHLPHPTRPTTGLALDSEAAAS
ncbi:ATP-binding protein [Kitasatospora sp. NPDC002227]|uniref:ATP-binding protein n=1 Tax=Kitasatospora sp. NPDC002227 TaxID=3154773 RepID=UPI00331F92AC